MTNYTELFKDVRWQKKRLEVLNANNWECENCGDKEKTLMVHHKFYKKDHLPWEYDSSDLLCLCEDCHNEYHKLLEIFKTVGQDLGLCDLYRLLGYYHCLEENDISNIEPLNYEHAMGIADFCGKHINTIINQKSK